MKNENGIALCSGVNGNLEVMVDVSRVPPKLSSYRSTKNLSSALYDADRKAHEEAISNGGVRYINFVMP